MNDLNSWQVLSVEEFFSQINWKGQQLKLPQEKQLSESEPINWQTLSVAEFFSQSNWQGKPLAIRAEKQTNSTPSSYLTLAVADFFEYMNWEGQPKVASVPHMSSQIEIPADNEVSLNDLSDLF